MVDKLPKDIARCYGEGCPLKNNCLRFTAEQNTGEEYFFITPYEVDHCEYQIQRTDEK